MTHEAYTGLTARGDTLIKCRCGFEVTEKTEDEAWAAHPEARRPAPHSIAERSAA